MVRPGRPLLLPHEEHQGDTQHRWDDGDPEQRCDLVVEKLVAGQAEQWPDDCAEGIHRPVEAEHPAAGGLVDVLDEQGVTGRSANSLAEPVDHPPGQHTGPRRGRRDDDLAERRHTVAGRDQRAARVAIPEGARCELGQRRRPFGGTLNDPHDGRGRAQHRGEVDRQQWVEQLACGVLKKRDGRQHPHIASQPGAHLTIMPCGYFGLSLVTAW